ETFPLIERKSVPDVPEWVLYLPTVNASLNTLATILLVSGYVLIRQGKVNAHRNAMLCGFGVSVIFLISYLIYHYHVPSKKFPPIDGVREVYLVILLTHIVLAAAVPFLAVITIWRAL